MVARGWSWGRELTAKGHKGSFCADGNVPCLDTQLHTSIKIFLIYTLRRINFTICKLYLIKLKEKWHSKDQCNEVARMRWVMWS